MTIKVLTAADEWEDFEVSDLFPHMDANEQHTILTGHYGELGWEEWLPQEDFEKQNIGKNIGNELE